MIIYLCLLVCLAGALIYALASNPKAAELGRNMFWCGLLAFLLIGGPTVSLLHR